MTSCSGDRPGIQRCNETKNPYSRASSLTESIYRWLATGAKLEIDKRQSSPEVIAASEKEYSRGCFPR